MTSVGVPTNCRNLGPIWANKGFIFTQKNRHPTPCTSNGGLRMRIVRDYYIHENGAPWACGCDNSTARRFRQSGRLSPGFETCGLLIQNDLTLVSSALMSARTAAYLRGTVFFFVSQDNVIRAGALVSIRHLLARIARELASVGHRATVHSHAPFCVAHPLSHKQWHQTWGLACLFSKQLADIQEQWISEVALANKPCPVLGHQRMHNLSRIAQQRLSGFATDMDLRTSRDTAPIARIASGKTVAAIGTGRSLGRTACEQLAIRILYGAQPVF